MERTDKRRRMTEEGRERVRSNAREEGVGQRSGCPSTWNARVCGILISGIPETTDHPTLLPLLAAATTTSSDAATTITTSLHASPSRTAGLRHCKL